MAALGLRIGRGDKTSHRSAEGLLDASARAPGLRLLGLMSFAPSRCNFAPVIAIVCVLMHIALRAKNLQVRCKKLKRRVGALRPNMVNMQRRGPANLSPAAAAPIAASSDDFRPNIVMNIQRNKLSPELSVQYSIRVSFIGAPHLAPAMIAAGSLLSPMLRAKVARAQRLAALPSGICAAPFVPHTPQPLVHRVQGNQDQ